MLFYLSSILNFHLLSIMIIKIISPLIVIPLSRTLKAIKRLNSQVLIALRVITVWMRISQADTYDMTNTKARVCNHQFRHGKMQSQNNSKSTFCITKLQRLKQFLFFLKKVVYLCNSPKITFFLFRYLNTRARILVQS